MKEFVFIMSINRAAVTIRQCAAVGVASLFSNETAKKKRRNLAVNQFRDMLRVVNMSITQLENLMDATLMVLFARAESSSQTLGACVREILNVSAALSCI